jgi:hypothetical protein
LTFSIRLESGMVHAGDMIIFDEKQRLDLQLSVTGVPDSTTIEFRETICLGNILDRVRIEEGIERSHGPTDCGNGIARRPPVDFSQSFVD